MAKQIFTRTITKRSMFERIYESNSDKHAHISLVDAQAAVEKLFSLMFDGVASGKYVYMRGFGKITTCFKPGGRPVRNPKTGEPYVLGDKVQVRFMANRGTTTRARSRQKLLESEILEKLADEFGFQAAKVVHNEFKKCLREVLEEGARIEIRGFGTFYRKERNEYQGRNPKTGELVSVGKKYILVYKIAKHLKRETEAHFGITQEA